MDTRPCLTNVWTVAPQQLAAYEQRLIQTDRLELDDGTDASVLQDLVSGQWDVQRNERGSILDLIGHGCATQR